VSDADREDARDYDAMNAAIRAQNLNVPFAAARARLVAAHEQVIAAIGALDEGELRRPYARFVAPFRRWGTAAYGTQHAASLRWRSVYVSMF